MYETFTQVREALPEDCLLVASIIWEDLLSNLVVDEHIEVFLEAAYMARTPKKTVLETFIDNYYYLREMRKKDRTLEFETIGGGIITYGKWQRLNVD